MSSKRGSQHPDREQKRGQLQTSSKMGRAGEKRHKNVKLGHENRIPLHPGVDHHFPAIQIAILGYAPCSDTPNLPLKLC